MRLSPERLWRRLRDEAGGRWQIRLLLLLAVTQALDAADRGALGAMAPSLKDEFGISNTRIGLLVAVSSAVGALATVPAGVLTDRVRRTGLLAASVALWSVAMVASAASTTFLMFFAARVALGVVLATAGPATASITGDLYPERKRARVFGAVRTGELLGMGAAFVLVGVFTWALSWRSVFVALAVVGAGTAWLLRSTRDPQRRADRPRELDGREVQDLVLEQGVEPRREAVLEVDSDDLSLPDVVRYAFRVRSNAALIVAEGAGDFFLSGVATFAVVFATQQYGISQATAAMLIPLAGLGAVAGTLGGGRLGDWLVERRHRAAGRLTVAGFGYLVAVAAFVPTLFLDAVVAALPLLVVAGAGLTAANPTLDAARLDIIYGRAWGRVEGIRTVVRSLGVASAPLVVGALSDLLGGGAAGLRRAILLLLPLLVANAVALLLLRGPYRHDVAAAARSGPDAEAGDEPDGHRG